MSRVCELTAKRVMSGNKVSHAVNRTKRKFLPNLQNVSLLSETLGRALRLRVSVAGLRAVEHKGGIDEYLMGVRPSVLSPRAQAFRKELLAKTPETKREPVKREKRIGAKAQKAHTNKTQAKKAPAKKTQEPSAEKVETAQE